MFDQSQIQEFKEAFNIIDQNRDGFIDAKDLKEMMVSLGKEVPERYIEEMLEESRGNLNFTMFLTLFGEKLSGTDPEDVIKNAFACFDEEGTGKIHEDRLRELLTTMGDRFNNEQVDNMFQAVTPDENGLFDYIQFIRIIKYGSKDD
ncbi:Myosin regulatory light chain [Oopsacas minuta]|uniref:Myosin regulatory light chain n=1 Tax=Oopsacas minuta TaxID=111878 RepID=A0AAV7JK05_9METZ|nr:Myosin regulatory light chain [Oopsacas minuta]